MTLDSFLNLRYKVFLKMINYQRNVIISIFRRRKCFMLKLKSNLIIILLGGLVTIISDVIFDCYEIRKSQLKN